MCAAPHGIRPSALHMGTISQTGGGLHVVCRPSRLGRRGPHPLRNPLNTHFHPESLQLINSDSPVHGLYLQWSGHSGLSNLWARRSYVPTSIPGWALECFQWIQLKMRTQSHTGTHTFTKSPVDPVAWQMEISCLICLKGRMWSSLSCCFHTAGTRKHFGSHYKVGTLLWFRKYWAELATSKHHWLVVRCKPLQADNYM